MSSGARMPGEKRRSLFATVAPVVGVLAAVGWFLTAQQMTRGVHLAQQSRSLAQVGELIALLRQATQARAKGDAQLLAEDPRLKSTLSASNVDDATILDILEDVQKLNGQPVFAVLSASGEVRVALGAPKLTGLDLSTSSVVKAARAQEGAALGVWLIEDRIAEVAVSAVRVGDRTVALLLVGNQVSDEALTAIANTAGVHLALMTDERLVWADRSVAASVWEGKVERIEVNDAVPPARFIAAPIKEEDAMPQLAFAVPLAALAFAVLSFWRGGAR